MRRRALLALAHLGRIVGAAVTLGGALVVGVSLHANTPAFRRFARDIANDATSHAFAGKLVVGDVDSLSIGSTSSARIRRVEILDPDGHRAILANDVAAKIELRRLLRSLATTGMADVELDDVSIGNAEVALDADATGATSLARAFRSATTTSTAASTSKSSSPSTKARPRVAIARATIGHAFVHGNVVPPRLDADADDLHARFRLENDRIDVALERGHVVMRAPMIPSQKAPLVGDAHGELALDLGTTQTPRSANVTFEGACAGAPIKATAAVAGDHVTAAVDVARTEPATLVAAFGDLVPVTQPVELHAKAEGTLPSLALSSNVKVGAAEAKVAGTLDLREGRAFDVTVDASHVDARAFGVNVPTDLSGKVTANGNVFAAGPFGTYHVVSEAGKIDGQEIPPVTIEGRFEPKQATAVFRAEEPGVDANGKITLDVPAKVATFDLQARSDSLRAVRRLPTKIGGAASARAQGKVDLSTKTVHATTTVSADAVAIDTFAAKHFSASGVVDGPLAAPVASVGFAGVDLQMKVGNKAPLVYPSATGRAKVALAPTPRIVEAQIDLGEPGTKGAVSASAEGIAFEHGVVDVRGLRVDGLGEPLELDARVGKGEWRVRAKSRSLDIRRAIGITGIKELALLPEDTNAMVDVDVRQSGSAPANGHVDVVVRSEKGLGSGPIAFETHATIDEGKLVGRSKLTATGFGEVEITNAAVDLPARMDRRSLERMTGIVELRGSIDLSQGAALFGGERVERVSGTAFFDARIERHGAGTRPTVSATARTQGLEVALTGETPTSTIEIAGIDVSTHVAWDGLSNDAELAFVSWDRHGVLGSAGAKAKVPLDDWLLGVQKLDLHALADLRLNAIVDAPSRDIASLPPFLSPPPLRGRVDGRVDLSGTLGHPQVVVRAHGSRLREDRTNVTRPSGANPVDGTLEANWDGERAAVTFAIDERDRAPTGPAPTEAPKAAPPAQPARPSSRRKMGHLRGFALLTDLHASDLLFGRKPPWRASGELEAEGLPLGALPASSRQTRVTGFLSGRARISDLNQTPSFQANAHVDDLGVGGATVHSVDVTAGGRDASLFVRADLVDQASHATIQLASTSFRTKGLEASWDSSAATRVDYAIQNGRLALLAPLLRRSVSEIDGRVDGAGSITVDDKKQTVEGGLAIQGARLYVNVLGEEISSLDAVARFDPNGVFRIDDAHGKMGAGEFHAAINGQMKGFHFDHADMTLVASKDGIPISSQGAIFADATGEVHVSAKMAPDQNALMLDVNVPRAEASLPNSTQTLQSLDPDPTIAIGVRKHGKLDTSAVRKARGGTGGTTTKPEDTLAVTMTVELGKDVRLEGRGMDVNLGGRTLVQMNDELKVTGRIDLRGGTIDVHGRRFTVDQGTVTFPEGGDPGNPTLVATAHWDSPDGTRVFVDYAAPIKSGKPPKLRSEPQLSDNAILSVLLFGQPDPNQAAAATSQDQGAGGSEAGAGLAVGGGFLAAPVNQALGEIDPNLEVDTDTLSGNRVRVKLGRSFFDRRLKVSVGQASGTATFRDPDTTYVFLNWQFVPKWSVVATGGDTGTTIFDVLFQHRY